MDLFSRIANAGEFVPTIVKSMAPCRKGVTTGVHLWQDFVPYLFEGSRRPNAHIKIISP